MSDGSRIFFSFEYSVGFIPPEDVQSINGTNVSNYTSGGYYYRIVKYMQYEAKDNEGEVYSAQCQMRDPLPADRFDTASFLCRVDIETEKLSALLCEEGSWLKIVIPSSNVLVFENEQQGNIYQESAKIYFSQMEPMDEEDAFGMCPIVITATEMDPESGGGGSECAEGEVLEGDECVPEEDPEDPPDPDDPVVCEEACEVGFVCLEGSVLPTQRPISVPRSSAVPDAFATVKPEIAKILISIFLPKGARAVPPIVPTTPTAATTSRTTTLPAVLIPPNAPTPRAGASSIPRRRSIPLS